MSKYIETQIEHDSTSFHRDLSVALPHYLRVFPRKGMGLVETAPLSIPFLRQELNINLDIPEDEVLRQTAKITGFFTFEELSQSISSETRKIALTFSFYKYLTDQKDQDPVLTLQSKLKDRHHIHPDTVISFLTINESLRRFHTIDPTHHK
jgi:hypothetical protein